MLLIDGVKYEEWTPATEDEFERVVEEHVKDIFGNQSIYLEKHKLRTRSGIGSIPDGYVIVPGEQPHWHIVEVELSSHPLYEHIVPQISKFISGIRNPSTQKEIVDALFHEIDSDEFRRLQLKKAIGTTETYKFLADLVSRPPVVTIIIEKRTDQLDEAISALAHSQIKIVEFQTFVREGVGLAVHAHLFEPLHAVLSPPPLSPTQSGDRVETTLQAWHIKYGYIGIPTRKDLFPDSETRLTLVTNIGVVEANFIPRYSRVALRRWFRAHPELKVGDTLIIEPIEPMKRYRLEIA